MKFVLIAAAVALSASAFAADGAKPVALTDAQMAKVVAGSPSSLYIYNSKAGGNYAEAYQSNNSNATVYQSHRGVTTCVRTCD